MLLKVFLRGIIILLIITNVFSVAAQAFRSWLPVLCRLIAYTTKDGFHLARFFLICNVFLAHGQFIEVAEADVSSDQSLTTPVVSRNYRCTPYFLLVNVVYVQAYCLVLIDSDVLCK